MSIKILRSQILLTAFLFLLSTYAALAQSGPAAKDASDATIDANRDMTANPAWHDDHDFEFVRRGFIAKPQSTVIRGVSGKVVWNMDQFADQEIDAPAPDTVNPSLWRQPMNSAAFDTWHYNNVNCMRPHPSGMAAIHGK